MLRLNKVLAQAGLASRRGADRLIVEGRVRVNGQLVTELGVQVDPAKDTVKVDGKRIPPAPAEHTYLMLNKPRGYVTTLADPEGRPTVRDLVGDRRRLFPVGRLDFHTEGLLLMTDDGSLARALTHPTSGVPKTYHAKVRGTPNARALDRLRRGIVIEGRRTAPADARVLKPGPNSWIVLTITEGRKHQVRKMCDHIGHPVGRLKRVAYAGLELGDLPRGASRPLGSGELHKLRRAASVRAT